MSRGTPGFSGADLANLVNSYGSETPTGDTAFVGLPCAEDTRPASTSR